MIFKQINQQWYHIRKARVVTQNKTSLRNYRQALTQARRKVHIQAKQYQDMIQDQYLQKHAQQTKLKHFNNQCDFRKKIAQQGFKLQQNLVAWKKQDQKTSQKFNKYLHTEDLKRINRERIKKIMTFQSENYWYTSQNTEERLSDEVIFPEYVASTQYYHRLHSQALVYQNFDFQLLHRVRSNQQVIKQKNKLLIPIFNTIKIKIKQYKTDKQKQIIYLHQIALDKINLLHVSDVQKSKLIEQQQKEFEKKANQYRSRLADPVKRQNFIKQKLRVLLSILNSWKQYTNILGMTSGQMMRDIEEARKQGSITSIKTNVMNEIRSVKNTTFVDAIEEDTEDVQITFEDYVSKLKDAQMAPHQETLDIKESVQVIELDGLLKQAESQLKASKVDLTKSREPSAKINLGSLVQGIENPIEYEIKEVPLSYLNFNQTTSSIEVMKQVYKNDEDMIKLLNQIGQISVEYPKLFKTIWENTYTIV